MRLKIREFGWQFMIAGLTVMGTSVALADQSRQENWTQCTSGDPQRSIAACSALIQSGQEGPENLAAAFDNRGLAYAHKHDFESAIREYNQSLQINPDSATAHYNRGVAYEFKGDYDRALLDLDQAVRMTPNDADSVFCRGLAFEHIGDYDRAIQDYDRTLRINPTYAAALYNRSLSYLHKGDYVRAMADYAHWRWLRDGVVGWVGLCLVLLALGFGIREFREGGRDTTQSLRRFMGWIFAAECTNHLEVALSRTNGIRQHSTFPISVFPALSLVVAVISGMAWWNIWRGKSSARGFGIAASVMQILIFLGQFVPSSPRAWDYHLVALWIGMVGLLAFLSRKQEWPPWSITRRDQSHFTSLFPDESSVSKVAK